MITCPINKTFLQEYYQLAFRKTLYESIEQLQTDIDARFHTINTERANPANVCCDRKPLAAIIEVKDIWNDKFVSSPSTEIRLRKNDGLSDLV